MNIFAFNHVSLLVADTARALEFYCGVLGLAVDESRPKLTFPGAWLALGNGQIHLLELPDTGSHGGPHEHGGRDRHVAMSVRDLDTITAALEAAGIRYSSSRSGRRALFCRDPDGNAIELVEVVAG